MEIVSRKNQRVAHFKKLAASASYRRECREYLCDGGKLLEEALKWGADVREVMAAETPDLELPAGARFYRVPREVLEAASPMKTPKDLVFTVGMPERTALPDLRGAVILENLQDPGNVGAVLRSAGAFGIKTVALIGECADLWSPKTVRASMGAVFRGNAVELTMEELRELSKTTPVYGAALRRGARDIRGVDLTGAAVAVGNEGSGLTEELISLCAGTVIIPMDPGCESLNASVAASVIMWELSRGRL